MSIVAEKITDQALELTMDERAFIARKLISSLETETDLSDETEWLEVIDRRSREIAEGKVTCQPVQNSLRDIRARLDAARR